MPKQKPPTGGSFISTLLIKMLLMCKKKVSISEQRWIYSSKSSCQY